MTRISRAKFMDRDYVVDQQARYLNQVTGMLKRGNIKDEQELINLWELYNILDNSMVNPKPNVYNLDSGLVISWDLLNNSMHRSPTLGRMYKAKTAKGHTFKNGDTIEVMINLSKQRLNADIKDYEDFKEKGPYATSCFASAGKFERIGVPRNSVVDFHKDFDFFKFPLDYVCLYYPDKLEIK